MNKTSSAVRLIHKPTGIVVASQQERSQFQNKDNCMKMLRAKLLELKAQQHAEKISDIKGVQMKIEWEARSAPTSSCPTRWLRTPAQALRPATWTA